MAAAREPRTADRTEDCVDGPGPDPPGRERRETIPAALALAQRLREALCDRQERVVESLLRAGADPNLVLSDGVAAVHLAAGSEHESSLQCLMVLLRHGANPNARSEDALTPVHVAASWGCCKCLKLLLREGGDPELQDQDGKQALDLALEQGNKECVEILREHTGPQEAPSCHALCRGEDRGGSPFSALNGEDLDTSIWGLSDRTFSPGPLGSIVRAQLDGSEVERTALGAGHSLPSQPLPAHLQLSQEKGLRMDKVSEPDISFPAPLSPHPTSTPLAPRLGSVPHLGQDDISPDHSCFFYLGPDYSWKAQTETPPSSPLAETGSSSNESFFTAVEVCGPDAQAPRAVPSSSVTPEAPGAVPLQPKKSGSGSQPGNTAESSPTQILPVDMGSPDSKAPQTSGPLKKDVTYASLRAELRAMILNTWHSQPTLDESDMIPAMTDPVIHLNAQLRGLVLGSPPEPQDFGISCKLKGLSSHNREGSITSHSGNSGEQGPPPKIPPGRYGPGSGGNESPREGKYLTLDSLEVARAALPTTQTGNLAEFTEDNPFNDFLTDDQTSQGSEDGANIWLTEDGEDEEDHVLQGLRVSTNQNCIRKPPEPSRARPILHPKQFPVGQSLQPSRPKPTEHIHTDPKAGLKLPVHTEDIITDRRINCDPSTPFPPQDPSTLSNQELLKHLRALGESPGPITPFTRQYYLRRLKEGSLRGPAAPTRYSPELTLALQTGCVPNAQDDEDVLAQQFDQPDRTQRWREGIVKSSFTYLLLDPRVTQNLPARCHILSPAECFQTFIHAIFYVGKGTRTRPYSHLSEALSHQRNRQKQTCPKVQHILDIWATGHGVVSLHCFQNVIAVEAYTREACLVDALGMQVLSNQKKGHYYGVIASWPLHRRRRLGVHLLHRALGIFLAEGERQLRPPDVPVGT
ncbi:ankyrin repeat and LEM domain-containing protein 1 isoform X2 [Monodelphis domestica]|uniref:ankyrin repeat and LEM domain-containing protein 1 isoform X2 n=2 Tax=Monodelphis domestica TaxID=13616 RepID=UPI0004435C9E|nr:ankyrin repeat and LEM domain-containing protein 1 isoform X2 [Monodelphis domestica]